ncbi:hypothetical protein [Risungbinella massiliensis]|uniref:hypothetical protein n=1 Tax=Risungbinella massiliensis TaxID=1329796 RepID=UPI0005CC776A|nr:hypothetical protein [Risungbinella massiliensis]
MLPKHIRKIDIYNVGEFKKLAQGKFADKLMTIITPKSYFAETVYLDHIAIVHIQSGTEQTKQVIVQMKPYQEGLWLTFFYEDGSVMDYGMYLGTDNELYLNGLYFQHCSDSYRKLKISVG